MSFSIKGLLDRLSVTLGGRGKDKKSEKRYVPGGRYTPQLIFDPTGTVVVGVNDKAPLKRVVIPDHVKKIAQRAFRNNRSVEEIYIPDSVSEIEKYAFAFCDSLRNVRLPEGLENIPFGCFYKSGRLSEMIFPDSLKSIGGEAFIGTALSHIELPDGLNTVYDGAFRGCPIVSLKLGSRLSMIGSEAFGDCGKLISLVLPKGLEHIGSGAFGNCGSLRSLIFLGLPALMGEGVFAGCTSIEKLRVPVSPNFSDIVLQTNTRLRTLTVGKYNFDIRRIIEPDRRNLSSFIRMASLIIKGDASAFNKGAYSFGKIPVFITYFRLALMGCGNAMDYLKNTCAEPLPRLLREESGKFAEGLIGEYGDSLSSEQIGDLLEIAVRFELHEAYVMLLQFKRERFGFDGDNSPDGSTVGNRFDL